MQEKFSHGEKDEFSVVPAHIGLAAEFYSHSQAHFSRDIGETLARPSIVMDSAIYFR